MRNRIIGLCIGLVAAVLYLSTMHRGTAARWDLLPEDRGSLATIALQYTHNSGSVTRAAYRVFLKQLEASTEVIAVCGDNDDATEFRAFVKTLSLVNPARVKVAIVGAPITGWCKDRFLVARGNPVRLVVPLHDESGLPGRDSDELVAPTLERAGAGSFRAETAPLRFDAGDLSATRSTLIVSDTLWIKNARPKHFDQRLGALFGKRLIWLHGVPDHHIGMFAAPLDDRMAAVGDPNLGAALWRRSPDAGLGRPDFSHASTAPFRRAATELHAAGYTILPLPTLVFAPKVYLSYTNSVYETRGARRIVYMPWYGVPALDQFAKSAYEKSGWEVRPIPVRTLMRYRGTIGCLINVLKRGD